LAVVLSGLSMLGAAACGDDGSKAPRPDGATAITIDAPGGKLDAVEMGEGPVGVVLAHGASTTKELWYPLMPALADAGMHAVAFDFGSDRDGDVRAVMSYLDDAGAEKIVLIGSSLGAANVLDVASRDPVAAVVTFSVGENGTWSIDEPGLYIASEGDGGTADAARALADEFSGKALVVDGGTHGADLLKPHPEVIDDVVAFIKKSAPAA
jgi:pimeloyl-ACP methyl ester carboxylesterase